MEFIAFIVEPSDAVFKVVFLFDGRCSLSEHLIEIFSVGQAHVVAKMSYQLLFGNSSLV